MRSVKFLCAVALLTCILSPAPSAMAGSWWLYDEFHAGSISLTMDPMSELTGQGDWSSPGSSIAWAVWKVNPDDSWHYEYHVSVPAGDISHFILEMSLDVSLADIENPTASVEGWNPEEDLELGFFSSDNGNPNMPGTMFGLKFEGLDATEVTLGFDVARSPTGGDAYLKGGSNNQLWNSGFLPEEAPGLGLPGDPELNKIVNMANHILVPDPVAPEPATILGAFGGLCFLGAYIRRRRTA